MTRLLITPRYGFVTTGFSFTPFTWREAKGSCFMMEVKQQAAGDLLTLTGSQGPGSQLRNAEEPSSCPAPRPLYSLSIRFTDQAVGHKLRNPISDIWPVLKNKSRELHMHHKEHPSCSCVCVFFTFWDACPQLCFISCHRFLQHFCSSLLT